MKEEIGIICIFASMSRNERARSPKSRSERRAREKLKHANVVEESEVRACESEKVCEYA